MSPTPTPTQTKLSVLRALIATLGVVAVAAIWTASILEAREIAVTMRDVTDAERLRQHGILVSPGGKRRGRRRR